MAKLIYSAITSLDGYIEDDSGRFDWAEPDEEVHRFLNDLNRAAGTYLYGRRIYETMVGWETDPSLAAQSPVMKDFASIWQAADKVVYSTTLDAVSTTRTRIERVFDPGMLREQVDLGAERLRSENVRAQIQSVKEFVGDAGLEPTTSVHRGRSA
jgi:RibD C-terminal domain